MTDVVRPPVPDAECEPAPGDDEGRPDGPASTGSVSGDGASGAEEGGQVTTGRNASPGEAGAHDDPAGHEAGHEVVALFDQAAAGTHSEDDRPQTSPDEEAPPVVHPRLWQRRLAVLGDAGRRRLRWVVAGVAALAAVCVALLVLHTPLLAVRHATVQGATHTGAAAVLDAAGLVDEPPLIDVNPTSAAAQVERLPWVKRAVVVRHWPDSVVVRVTERVAVGAFALRGGQVALVDATGRVLAWEAGPVPGPTLAGPTPAGRPGTDIAAADQPALEVAALLPSSITGDVVEVSVSRRGALTLTLAGRVTAVLGDAAELPAKLDSLASVLTNTRVTRGWRIDVTVPQDPIVGPPPPPSSPGAGGR